jgi:dipeptidyl-peptidase-3
MATLTDISSINVPNFDDVRQSEGFKNVCLGNVLNAKAPDEKISFIALDDLPVYSKYHIKALEIKTAIHELLGHGTGKLLQEISPGSYNFNIDSPPISPITKKPISTWYKPGQTWRSVFGSLGSSFEECRAECIGIVLSCEFSILKIFGFGNGEVDINGEAGEVLYTAYLDMARAGVTSLQAWDPNSRKWGQVRDSSVFI